MDANGVDGFTAEEHGEKRRKRFAKKGTSRKKKKKDLKKKKERGERGEIRTKDMRNKSPIGIKRSAVTLPCFKW